MPSARQLLMQPVLLPMVGAVSQVWSDQQFHQPQQRQAQHSWFRRQMQPRWISPTVARLQVCLCRFQVCFHCCLCHCLSRCQVFHDLEQSAAPVVARCAVVLSPAQLLQQWPQRPPQLATQAEARAAHGWRSWRHWGCLQAGHQYYWHVASWRVKHHRLVCHVSGSQRWGFGLIPRLEGDTMRVSHAGCPAFSAILEVVGRAAAAATAEEDQCPEEDQCQHCFQPSYRHAGSACLHKPLPPAALYHWAKKG
mmetsp:Transcript_128617/g.222921  ORF Transcript_128617/g.222921 Transcript_128617/m.222921 type:complete len:251 (-) Transcript_128617:15-767(-)